MGALLLKKTCLLFLIISASILSTSFAGGRQSRFVNNSEKELGATQKEEVYHDEALYEIHERFLKLTPKTTEDMIQHQH
ncbi:unnamed protein product [Ilex paraguariensis]|uniref:Uncharacterized protein n=1 Tax=Ilex paraguariensis TaxID=185542 RepID=A0ABC8QN30_9AQUA